MQYISGPYTQGQLLKDIDEIELALTDRFKIGGVITDAAEQRSWRERLQDASFARNTVMYDDQGNPSVMVARHVQRYVDLGIGSSENPHDAFIVNGAVKPVYHVSKYQNIVVGSGAAMRALSLKHMDPANNINWDNAALACKQKGPGWHLNTNAEWSEVALSAKKEGFMPRGNNYYGSDHSVSSEKGIGSYFSGDRIGRVLTGSGPITWSHDGTPFGIYDYNGNVREWNGGLRLMDGEIQILANNNAADNTKDQSATSIEWRAIMPDGTLVDPGTVGTLKFDYTEPVVSGSTASFHITDFLVNQQVSDDPYGSKTFETLTANSGVAIPDILKALGVFPLDSDHGADGIYFRNNGEKLPFRGGNWYSGSNAGVFYLYLYAPRSYVSTNLGFRSAFVL